MEIRNVMARIVTEFDVKFAPGEDGTKLLEESHDTFTIALAPLELMFTRREIWGLSLGSECWNVVVVLSDSYIPAYPILATRPG